MTRLERHAQGGYPASDLEPPLFQTSTRHLIISTLSESSQRSPGARHLFEEIRRAPLASGRIASNLLDDFSSATSLRDHLKTAAYHLDLNLETESSAGIRAGIPALIDAWGTAAAKVDSAFASLTPAERANLRPSAAALLPRFGATF